jgi:hypothetical protein
MQPVTLIASHKALRIIAGHSPPPPSDAFLDFDPILSGWPEEPGDEDTTPRLDFASAVTPLSKTGHAKLIRSSSDHDVTHAG